MSTNPDQSHPNTRRIGRAWGAVVASIEHANRISHHALSWLFVTVVVGYFIFCAMFLGLRYLVLPNIDHYKPEVVQAASRMLNRPVSVAGIHASWRGLLPRLQLDDVVIHDDHGDRVLQLPQVNATFSWFTLFGQLRLHSLEVISPDLEIERAQDGSLYVAGMRIDPNQSDDGRVLEWLLAQREIVIRGGTLRWRDQFRQAPELMLSDISFVLRNQWRSHQAVLHATPPAELAAPIDLRADFTHPPFAPRRADYANWSGELYVDWRNTHLDGWKQFIDLPWELSGGDGALRAWMSVDHGVIGNVTADIALNNVSATLGPNLQPLKLIEVGGRLSAGESAVGLKDKLAEKLFSFGAHGHTVTLTDFSLRTEQGSVLPRTTASYRYVVAEGKRAERHELKVTQLDLDALSQLARHLPLSPEEKRILDELMPRGQLSNFSASWDGALPGQGDYKISGRFDNLAIREQLPTGEGRTAVPGFEGLSGDIDATQEGGHVKLSGERSTLHLANYLNNSTLFFDRMAIDGGWTFRNNRQQLAIKLSSLDFQQSGLKGRIEGTHQLPWPLTAGHLGDIDVRAHFPSVELNRVVGYLPTTVGPETRDWMSGGLLDGHADDVNIVLKGDLQKFPFLPKAGAAQSDGVFKLSAKVRQAKVSPAPLVLAPDRRTPMWPHIEEIEGQVTIDRSRLQVHVDSAKTFGMPLSNVDVVIADFLAAAPVLDISGSASGNLQPMIAYVNASPVSDWIDDLTEEARASGSARVTLKLRVPLIDSVQPSVQGSVKFNGNEVQLWRSLPTVTQMHGELGFSDRGFQLTGLQGTLLGGPLAISGGTQRDGSTAVRLDGVMTADGIARFAANPAMKRFARKLSGSTRYTANVKVKNQRLDFSLDSSLAGMAIDLPAPLQKASGESLPLRVSIAPAGLFDTATQSEEIKLGLGRAISARYLRQRPVSKASGWHLVRGGIGVNTPPPLIDTGVALSISLSSLNADAWREVMSGLSPEGTGVAEGLPVSSFLTVDAVNIRTGELTLANRVFNNAVIGATRMRGGWQFNINSDTIVGRATWEDPWVERGAGKISARLATLKLEQREATDVTELLGAQKSFTELPGLDIIADNFELRGMRLGRLELAATNAGLTSGPGREWRISKLAISNPGANMRASGRWLTQRNENQSSLSYELEIADAGQLLDRLGFERTLKGGKGKMEGELSWRGDPTEFDFPTLSGKLSTKLTGGQFLKADPGVAKLLGVMSLQSLPRRLTLDFRDVFSEGFAFDTIASTATITQGTLKTDSFKMRGPSAVVLMDGSVDLAKETQTLGVVVIPELNAGGASVLYGLAVNPVIGLGTFLAQYVLKNPMSAALTQEYQITGPWRDPVIKKASSRRKPVEQGAVQRGAQND
jgi:uncharacterized protein (TIGR02099 family)